MKQHEIFNTHIQCNTSTMVATLLASNHITARTRKFMGAFMASDYKSLSALVTKDNIDAALECMIHIAEMTHFQSCISTTYMHELVWLKLIIYPHINDAFIKACENGRLVVVKWICVNAKLLEEHGYGTPDEQLYARGMYSSCANRHMDIVSWMLKMGFDEQTRDNVCQLVLKMATQHTTTHSDYIIKCMQSYMFI